MRSHALADLTPAEVPGPHRATGARLHAALDDPERLTATRREARRRLRLIRRRRLDLLQDCALALIVALFVLIESAGLGVVAILAIPTALILVASLIVERRLRRRPASDSARWSRARAG